MRVRMRCPNCEQLLMVREEEVGRAGRCPGCRQEVTLIPVKQTSNAAANVVPKPADPAIPLGPVSSTQGMPQAEPNRGIGASLAPDAEANPEDADLAVEALGDDVARELVDIHGAIPVAHTGPPRHGRQRSPALVFLLALFPPYWVYWFIVARAEIRAHLKQPPASAVQVVATVLLAVLTAGMLYCFYLVPRRIVAMQSKCGDPNRVSLPVCLFLGIIPVLGWALDISMMQRALTRHWQWHIQRGSDQVTAGLAG